MGVKKGGGEFLPSIPPMHPAGSNSPPRSHGKEKKERCVSHLFPTVLQTLEHHHSAIRCPPPPPLLLSPLQRKNGTLKAGKERGGDASVYRARKACSGKGVPF